MSLVVPRLYGIARLVLRCGRDRFRGCCMRCVHGAGRNEELARRGPAFALRRVKVLAEQNSCASGIDCSMKAVCSLSSRRPWRSAPALPPVLSACGWSVPQSPQRRRTFAALLQVSVKRGTQTPPCRIFGAAAGREMPAFPRYARQKSAKSLKKRSGRLAGSSSPPVPPIRPGNQSVVCCEAPESAGKRDTVSHTCRLSGSCCGIGVHLRRARLQGSALLHLALRRRCIALSRRPLREGTRPPVRGLVFLVIRLRLSASAAGAPAAP